MKNSIGVILLIFGILLIASFFNDRRLHAKLEAENRAKFEQLAPNNPLMQTVYNTPDKEGDGKYIPIALGILLSVIGYMKIGTNKKKEQDRL